MEGHRQQAREGASLACLRPAVYTTHGTADAELQAEAETRSMRQLTPGWGFAFSGVERALDEAREALRRRQGELQARVARVLQERDDASRAADEAMSSAARATEQAEAMEQTVLLKSQQASAAVEARDAALSRAGEMEAVAAAAAVARRAAEAEVETAEARAAEAREQRDAAVAEADARADEAVGAERRTAEALRRTEDALAAVRLFSCASSLASLRSSTHPGSECTNARPSPSRSDPRPQSKAEVKEQIREASRVVGELDEAFETAQGRLAAKARDSPRLAEIRSEIVGAVT